MAVFILVVVFIVAFIIVCTVWTPNCTVVLIALLHIPAREEFLLLTKLDHCFECTSSVEQLALLIAHYSGKKFIGSYPRALCASDSDQPPKLVPTTLHRSQQTGFSREIRSCSACLRFCLDLIGFSFLKLSRISGFPRMDFGFPRLDLTDFREWILRISANGSYEVCRENSEF